MKRFIFPLSALLVVVLPLESIAQSVSSSSMSSSSASSVLSSSSSSSQSSSESSSSSSSSSRSSRSSSLSSSSRSRSSSSERDRDMLELQDIDLDRYSDAPWDLRTNIAVSALTGIGVLQGNDDGTYRPNRTLNRAEFITIIMRLLNDNGTVNTNCFPDVRPSDWYAEDVCRAKALRIVRGNARPGVQESLWRFEPNRDVQYEEAVKVLMKLYALPIAGDEEGLDWYVPFIEAAQDMDLVVPGLEPGDAITRGEMARLTVAFRAQSTDQLEELRDRESARSSSSRSRSSSSSRTSSRSSSSSSRTGTGSGVFDPITDRSVRSNILVLGEVSPILAGVKFFSNAEPIDVDHITVEFVDPVDSIASLLIYDQNGQLLGTATAAGSNTTFTANIPTDRFQLPRRQDRTTYVRARLNDDDSGGESGEQVRVESVTLSGQGNWSNDEYNTTSSDTFDLSRTAHGTITAVANAASSRGVLTSGTDRQLGEFRFTGRSPDGEHDVRVTALTFTIEQVGGVTLSNVRLRIEGSSEESSCTVGSTTITCSNIPASMGTLDDTKTIRVFGDVSVPGGANDPTLRLVLNDPGTPTTAGAVSWTDGTTTFTWLPMSQPVAGGTIYE